MSWFAGICAIACWNGPVTLAQQSDWGKSHHGSHYDEGPRSKPWKMEGIGTTHFPITTSHPEVQQWFDQGNTLLHGFWFFEAERAFRWCLKLDPDCAMAYWALARSVEGDPAREKRFFREAVKRKEDVSARERAYIELWEAKYKIKGKGEEREEAIREFVKRFDNLLIDYPNDIEARAIYWLEMLSATRRPEDYDFGFNPWRYSLDRVLQEVLAADPNHVGALHYRVHNWDGEEGHYALDTCLHLSKIAPNCGHLQHMPGHVLSSIGLWHEAAIAMDSATRVEKEYMRSRMVLPEQNWDYIHNLDYLAYIQEQLGMYEAALTSCRQLLNGPAASEYSPIGDFANWSLVRLLVKYEKWDEILNSDEQLFRWNSRSLSDPALRAYARTQALIGLGRLEEAAQELKAFDSKVAIFSMPEKISQLWTRWFSEPQQKSDKDKKEDAGPDGFLEQMIAVRQWELHAKLALAKGDQERGLGLLKKAAELQYENWRNDPPMDAVFLYNSLGELYLESGQLEEAAAAFEKTLEKVINDGFALSGLVIANQKLGRQEDAEDFQARLLAVWSNADRPNRWLESAEATGVKTVAAPNELLAERNYQETVLDKLGHSIWTPPLAPDLAVINSAGREVSLGEYQGKNVLLIFYLGDECLHCMEQMREANRLADQFADLNTEILAVSKDDLETINSYRDSDFKITLLSDPEFANARRFHSYDDFEEIELHSTILIDPAGRVHWSQHGGDPFMDFEFLTQEIRRLNLRNPALQTAQQDRN
jgi:peroxiredoxin